MGTDRGLISVPARADLRFDAGMSARHEVDATALERDLAEAVSGEVRFDTASRGLYATDASNFRQPPIGVVIPRSLDDVVATHEACRRHGAPILSRGAGTSLSGETVNYAVVMDHSKYLTRILGVDADRRTVQVENGAINAKVNEETGKRGLVFGPDPSTHEYCTIGGNIGNNSCGIHSIQAEFEGNGARTSDNVASLDILTYDGLRMTVGPTSDAELKRIIAEGGRRGQIYRDLRDLRDRYADLIRERYPKIPRRVSGYNLDDLLPESGFNVAAALCGTEATCATVLTAELKLVPNPSKRALLVIGYRDIAEAADHVPEIREHEPIGLEGIDHLLFEDEEQLGLRPDELSELPDGDAWLLVEFGGEDVEEADARAEELIARLKKDKDAPVAYEIVDEPAQTEAMWAIREAGLAATAFPPDGRDHWPGWEDSAVPPERMGDYIRDLRRLYDAYDYRGAMYGHLGQGCLHSRISFDLRSADGIKRYRSFMEEAADLVVSYGGSLSGEHGDGQQRGELLGRMYGDELIQAFREFKRIWDPDWKMNPGKVVDAYRLDEDLKLGANYNPPRHDVRFAYEEDDGDFAHAALRCVGVGKCTIPDGVDVMCPSYMVTREEKHTTRGRARLLFEMLQGDVVTDGWRSPEVKEALDLCLACKGCTNDCPVNVDMPTYKAEFLHHHWKGRLRPRHAYAFGLIDRAARLASKVPGLANFVGRTPPFAQLLKWAGGVTRERPVPAFAPLTLQDWFREHGERNIGGPRVILWPDTFNNYLHADVGMAAVEALEAAGWHVTMPEVHVCCGRPLYDYGFLNMAERYLRRTLDQLRDEIRAGTPIVGIEPSCLATFKDELAKLLPHDDDAGRMRSNVHHFSEFFREHDVEPPRLEGKALLWGHCHHKATGGMDPERELLERMGLEVEEVTGGCCGLAGSWGYEEGHYDISMAAGEEALLPAVRNADTSTLIVANGFSCTTQMEHGATERRGLHVAQVMQLAREHRRVEDLGARPEDAAPEGPRPGPRTKAARAGMIAGGMAAVAAASWGLGRLRRRR